MRSGLVLLLLLMVWCGTCSPAAPSGGTLALSYSSYFGGTGKDHITAMTTDTAGNVYLAGWTFASDFPVTAGALQSSPGSAFVARLNSSASAIVFATYFGAPASPLLALAVEAIAVDARGNVYLAGWASEGSIPIVNPLQPVCRGQSAFIAELDPTGSRLLFSTCLGGTGVSSAGALALDPDGNPVISGWGSAQFPTTPGAFQPALGEEAGPFVAKLDSKAPRLIYSTYVGRGTISGSSGLAVDGEGGAILVGVTWATNFPSTGAFPSPMGYGNCFVSKLNANGTALVYSRSLPGSCEAVAVDHAGNAWVVGGTSTCDFPVTAGAVQPWFRGRSSCCCGSHCLGVFVNRSYSSNAFLSGLNPAGTLVYSTYLGGSGSPPDGDTATAITLDADGNVWIAGATASTDFPMQNPLQSTRNCSSPGCPRNISSNQDVFVASINPAQGRLLFSTYLGSQNYDSVASIVAAPSGSIWIAGATGFGFVSEYGGWFNDFPVTRGALFSTTRTGTLSEVPDGGFLARLSPGTVSRPVPKLNFFQSLGAAASRPALLRVYGSGFTASSRVQINATDRETQLVSETQLVASLLPADTALASPVVRVLNMLPGGDIVGISNSSCQWETSPVGDIELRIAALDGAVPAEATATIDTTYQIASDGKLRVGLPVSPSPLYLVKVEAPGYQTATVRTRIFAWQTTALSLTLVPVGVGVSRTVTLPAARLVFDTGIDIQAGQTVIMYARGVWSFSPAALDQNLAAGGRPGCSADSLDWPLPSGGNCGALAARIGAAPWFSAGEAFSGRATSSGRLYLVMNDRFGAFADNSGTMEVTVVDLPVEPELRVNLQPGFYVAEVRLAQGQRQGYWSMQVTPPLGLAGGLIAGGGIQDGTQPPAWVALALARPATMRVEAVAQVLPGGDPARFSMVARLLGASRKQFGTDEPGGTALRFERALEAGFYIVELRGGSDAPRAYFQLGISVDSLAGPVYAGGFIAASLPGFGAFSLLQPQEIGIKVSGAPANGPDGAGNLQLRLQDANGKLIRSAP